MKPGEIGRVGQIHQLNRVHMHPTETNRERIREDVVRHVVVSLMIISPRESVTICEIAAPDLVSWNTRQISWRRREEMLVLT